MYEQMEESTDRCWAFNRAGQRCEMIAGHDSLHNVIIAWGPDECWKPGDTIEVSLKTHGPLIPQPEVEHLVEISDEELRESLGPVPTYGAEGRPGTCLLCSHPMHNAECPRGNCDCRSGVPAG